MTRIPNLARSLADLLLVTAAACVVAAIVLPLHQLARPGGEVEVWSTDPQRLRYGGLKGDAFLAGGAQHPLRLVAGTLPAGLRLATEAGPVLGLLTLAIAAVLFWRFLQAIGAGDPFRSSNATMLTRLAAVVGLGPNAVEVADHLTSIAVRHHLELAGPGSPVQSVLQVQIGPLLMAAVLLIVADAFRAGSRMRAELDGLV